MFQPMPVLLLTLLVGTTAAAESSPLARERIERRVTLPAGPTEATPEVRIARGFLTNLILDGPLEKSSVELSGRASHFRLVDVGEHTLVLEPSVELGSEERLGLRMRLKDGTRVALVLTSHPTQVDARVDVERPLSAETARAQLTEARARLAALEARCGEEDIVGLILSEGLDEAGVKAHKVSKVTSLEDPAGLELVSGWGYRATLWAVVDLKVSLPAEGRPWALGEVRLVGPGGLSVKAVPVKPSQTRLAPGERGRIILLLPEPSWTAETQFRLEVSSGSGPPLILGRVKL